MFVADALNAIAHVPTLRDNAFIDVMRVVCALGAGSVLLPMLVVARRNRNIGFYALAIFIFTSVIGELDQLGQPFIVYQLPLRLVGTVMAWYWVWKRRDTDYNVEH